MLDPELSRWKVVQVLCVSLGRYSVQLLRYNHLGVTYCSPYRSLPASITAFGPFLTLFKVLVELCRHVCAGLGQGYSVHIWDSQVMLALLHLNRM